MVPSHCTALINQGRAMLSGPAGQSMHAARVSSSAQDRAQAFCPSSPALSSGIGLTQLTCTDHVSTGMPNQTQQPQSVVTNGASLEMLFLILTYTGVRRGDTHTNLVSTFGGCAEWKLSSVLAKASV